VPGDADVPGAGGERQWLLRVPATCDTKQGERAWTKATEQRGVGGAHPGHPRRVQGRVRLAQGVEGTTQESARFLVNAPPRRRALCGSG
jgi:hypothetical protein